MFTEILNTVSVLAVFVAVTNIVVVRRWKGEPTVAAEQQHKLSACVINSGDIRDNSVEMIGT